MAKKQNTIYADTMRTDSSSGYVYVCLNRPTGIKFKLSGGRVVKIDGNAIDLRGAPIGVLPVGAYGITRVPEADWQEIKAMYSASMPIFERGLIFASSDMSSATAEAQDKQSLRNGLEPIDSKNAHTRGVPANEVM